MNDHDVPPSAVAQTPSWQPGAPLQLAGVFGAIDCTWAYITLGLLGATAMSILPS
jgi:hypothetical protein